MKKQQFQTGQISSQIGLHLRAQPDARSPSLEAMNYGTYVTIRKREGKWLYVTSPSGKLGWAYAAYVTGLKSFAEPTRWERCELALLEWLPHLIGIGASLIMAALVAAAWLL